MRYIITFEPSGLGMVKWRRLEVKVDGGYGVHGAAGVPRDAAVNGTGGA